MKCCSKCGEEKQLAEFYRDRRTEAGLRSECKECARGARRKQYASNPKREREGNRRAVRKYRAVNKDAVLKSARKYRDANRERLREMHRSYRHSRAESYRRRARDWQIAHPDKVAAAVARRKAQKLRATPAWADQRYIAIWYRLAVEESQRIGEPVEVDHIVPLRHPRVCGLHTHHNLQLLRASENRAKGNRVWPDMQVSDLEGK